MFIARLPDGRVYGKWTVQQWKDQEELPDNHPDLEFVATAEEVAKRQEAKIDTLDRLIFELEFNQENRIRVLEGKPQISRTQYRDALIAVYRSI